jgi:ferrous iron transport protein B
VLASNGPGSSFGNAEEIVRQDTTLNQDELEQKISAYKLEHSYLGRAGKFIEPAIAPLGYDWKIGIAIVSSFAAREVFVGTLATIYNVGTDEEDTIKNRMADEVHPDGKPVFTLASGMSLMIFYAFAMQCMSTLAIVRKETNSWRWPTIQLVVMTVIAYLAAFATFQLL